MNIILYLGAILIFIYFLIFCFKLFDFSNNYEQYRIVERRSSGCERIEYIPEKLENFSDEYYSLDFEYFLGRRFSKGYMSLSEAKNAIMEDIKQQREKIEASIKYPAYEKIHKV